MLQAFVNAFRIPELRNKLLFTMGMLMVYRIGFWIPVPGVDQTALSEYFQLGGTVNISEKVSLGISNVAARELGRTDDSGTDRFLADLGSGQSLNVVDGDIATAQNVVSNAISEVSAQRGRLGAFQKNTIGSTLNALNVTLENTPAAESVIRDADFAFESASLTRNQVLSQSAQNILSLANSQPQSALGLLG